MNIFRFVADMSHLASKFILIHRIFAMRSCRGLSLKTQALYLLVFITRYLDVFTRWVSLYNTCMKWFFICSSTYIIYLILVKFRPMDEEQSTDTFNPLYALVPPAVLAFVFNYRFEPMEILWSFSIFLEALAILPQLHMLKRTGQAEALTRYYIVALGSYRALYILNWIYRYVYEGVIDHISAISGVVQTCINFYFIYVYWRKYPNEKDNEFPHPMDDESQAGITQPELPKTPVPAAPAPPVTQDVSSETEAAVDRVPSPPAVPVEADAEVRA